MGGNPPPARYAMGCWWPLKPRSPRGCGTAGATRLSTEPWQGGAPRPGPGRGGAAADGHGPGRRRHDRDRGDRRRDDSPALGRGLGGYRRHDPNGAWDRGRRGFCLLPPFRSQGGGGRFVGWSRPRFATDTARPVFGSAVAAMACDPQHVEATAWSGSLGRRPHLPCRALHALLGREKLTSSVPRRRAVLPQ